MEQGMSESATGMKPCNESDNASLKASTVEGTPPSESLLPVPTRRMEGGRLLALLHLPRPVRVPEVAAMFMLKVVLELRTRTDPIMDCRLEESRRQLNLE